MLPYDIYCTVILNFKFLTSIVLKPIKKIASSFFYLLISIDLFDYWLFYLYFNGPNFAHIGTVLYAPQSYEWWPDTCLKTVSFGMIFLEAGCQSLRPPWPLWPLIRIYKWQCCWTATVVEQSTFFQWSTVRPALLSPFIKCSIVSDQHSVWLRRWRWCTPTATLGCSGWPFMVACWLKSFLSLLRFHCPARYQFHAARKVTHFSGESWKAKLVMYMICADSMRIVFLNVILLLMLASLKVTLINADAYPKSC